MKKLKKDTVQIMIIVILFILLIITWCGLFGVVFNPNNLFDPPVYRPVGLSRFSRSGSYKIDIETVVKNIDDGRTPVFLDESILLPLYENKSTKTWTQGEHLKVANALFEFVWKETLGEQWSVPQMQFGKNCDEDPVGFSSSAFYFDELIFQRGEFNYKSRGIEISLSDEIVSWGGNSGYPRPLLGTTQYYLDNLPITADAALSIAENNGGEAARQSVQNGCTIWASLEKNWQVIYYGPLRNNSSRLFEVTIDPYTGQAIEINGQ